MTDPPRRCHYATDPAGRPDCELTAVLCYATIPLCGGCNLLRSTLGKGQRPRPIGVGQPVDVLAWVADAHTELRATERVLTAAVARARQRGHPWAAIGERLGISRQAAQQRFGERNRA